MNCIFLKSEIGNRKSEIPRGFSLIELLIALALSAVLAVAVGAALSASMYAYATSSVEADMQTAGRSVMQRTLMLIRSSTLHDAYDPDNGAVTLLNPSDANHPLHTVGIQMQLSDDTQLKIWWAENEDYDTTDLGDLWYQQDDNAAEMLIERITCLRDADDTPYVFTLASRTSDGGLLLERASLDLKIQPQRDSRNQLEIAKAATGELRLVGSTVPRKNVQ